jgi:ABC-type multidrug transport system fused ATPase/permease subunit
MSYQYEESRLDRNIEEQIRINMKNVTLSSWARNISMLMTALVPILILGVGGLDVMREAMTIGTLVAFIQYTNRMFDPMRDLMGLYFDLVRASVSMDRIYEVLTLNHEENALSESTESSGRGDVEFEHISFSYDSQEILSDVSLKLRQGSKYAIVGASGCGKSTLINLLCRFYTPQQGKIKYEDRDIREIDLARWRQAINLLTQDNYLFHDTIKENIIYGGMQASQQEIDSATLQSRIFDHIVSMPDGFDSVVGDQGVTLSGGQKQRIAIARSLLRKAKIIILDEATSALDSETEERIIENLLDIYRDKTMIFISHRLSSIRNVDEIICMDHGRIVEVGDHDSLMKNQGYYWKLYKGQIV